MNTRMIMLLCAAALTAMFVACNKDNFKPNKEVAEQNRSAKSIDFSDLDLDFGDGDIFSQATKYGGDEIDDILEDYGINDHMGGTDSLLLIKLVLGMADDSITVEEFDTTRGPDWAWILANLGPCPEGWTNDGLCFSEDCVKDKVGDAFGELDNPEVNCFQVQVTTTAVSARVCSKDCSN